MPSDESDEIEQIRAAIAALEAQRTVLGDAVVDAGVAPLREKLAALTRAAPLADERKRVTVLFSDLAGFTATSETMDPEEVHAIMDAYFGYVTPPITEYGGTVEKYVGDAVMALFGAPKALENHEEMAVRAALAMQRALQAFNEELERKQGPRLAMRIGVNTGLVLFGAMGGRADTDFAAVGDTINVTSRLESACPVGRVMVSADTARPLHGIFDLEPPQQIAVKGKREPITVYAVLGEKAEPSQVRGVAGLQAPMVGRDHELSTLQTALDRALTSRCWEAAALVGEAGIGKSRLQSEFVAWVAEKHPEVRLLAGRCYAHTRATPYHLVAELMRSLFNLGADASPSRSLEQLGEALRLLDSEADEDEQRDRLGSLAGVLGFSLIDDPLEPLDPAERRDRTFLSLERLLAAASDVTPLLIVVEDLQWADALSLSFIERLAQMPDGRSATGAAALLLAVSRPAEDAESPLAALLARMAKPPRRTLTLGPLDVEQSHTLVTALLGESGLPGDVRSLVLQRSQGNPFFVQEILRSFVEDGNLTQDPATGAWKLTQAVTETDVPESVQSVLAARLDRLPGEEKRVIQHAAISGHTFWQRLVAEISDGRGRAELEAAVDAVLSRLEQRQLIQRLSESQIADDWEWLFRHVLAQEVAYEIVPRATRRKVHARIARWLEARVGNQAASLVPLAAYHYERGEVPDKAAEYLLQAGDLARGLYALQEAIDFYERALTFLRGQEAHEQSARTLMKLGLTYHLAFDFGRARQAYEEGFTLWQQAAEAAPAVSLPAAPHPLRADWPYPPLTLDPAMAADVDSTGVVDQLFSGLVELSPGMDVLPDLARSWEVLEGGEKYVFHLREDARWSDGASVTAYDFEYAWRRVLHPATESPAAGLLCDVKGATEFHEGVMSDPSRVGVHALDKTTLVVELERPTSYFPYLMAYNASFAVPRHVVDVHSEKWTEPQNIVTNGPFRLEAWSADGQLTLSRNAGYHGRFGGNVERVVLHSLPDPPARLEAYESGDLDTLFLWNPTEERDRARQRHAGEYVSVPWLAAAYVGFDTSRPPFDDERVRQAFAHAVDRETLADVVMGGYVFPATGGLVPPGMPGHSPGIALPFSPEKARELFDAAGYTKAKFPEVELLTEEGNEASGSYLTRQWEQNLGLRVAWSTAELPAFLERLEDDPPHIFLGAWYADYPDPDSFLRVCDAARWTRWQDASFREAVEGARCVTDQKERMAMYQLADRVLIEQAVIVPFVYWRSHLLVKPWLKRLPTSAIKWWFWKEAVIEPHD